MIEEAFSNKTKSIKAYLSIIVLSQSEVASVHSKEPLKCVCRERATWRWLICTLVRLQRKESGFPVGGRGWKHA